MFSIQKGESDALAATKAPLRPVFDLKSHFANQSFNLERFLTRIQQWARLPNPEVDSAPESNSGPKTRASRLAPRTSRLAPQAPCQVLLAASISAQANGVFEKLFNGPRFFSIALVVFEIGQGVEVPVGYPGHRFQRLASHHPPLFAFKKSN